MKKTFSLFLTIAMMAGLIQAQALFQGTLTYEMKLEGEGMEAMQGMMPNAINISVLKGNTSLEYEGGMFAAMMGRMVTNGKKGLTYMIKDSEEMIYVMDPKAMGGEEGEPVAPQIIEEDEVLEIAGYSCKKYSIVQNTPMGEQTSYVWATDKFKMPSSEGAGGAMGGGMVNVKGLPGMPLKVKVEQGPMTIVLLAKSVNTTLPNKSLFKLPKGYKQEPFDPNSLMGGMGM